MLIAASREGKLERICSRGLFLCLAVAMAGSVQAEPATPPVELIVSRMAEARARNQAKLRPYVVTRSYVLSGKDAEHQKSEVTAEVSFEPPFSKRYDIVETVGSGLGERIVRRMLDGETEIVENNGKTDISPANYDFRLVGEENAMGVRCYVIETLPKRKDKTLLRGRMWVDAETYLLRRMEAEPAKRASWWLKDTRVAFTYGDVEGMWLQIESEFTTNVRIFGRHSMTSRDVRYDFGERAADVAFERGPAAELAAPVR
jgi:outer membrane lipoprotein-sorting protein